MPKGDDAVCLTSPHQSMSSFQILLLEFIATGILVLVNCGFWDPRNSKKVDALPIIAGLTIVALSLVFVSIFFSLKWIKIFEGI